MSDRQYELVYILPPETTEQQAGELHEQIASTVSRMNGQIEMPGPRTRVWFPARLSGKGLTVAPVEPAVT